MAKLGEEDPRWIVSDRPDGTNINGWHWEETNKMTFCKDYFESQLNTEQNVSFGEKWFRLVSETFGNKSECCRPKVLDLERIRRGRVFSLDEEKGKKFGVFDLKVTMQYEVEVECMVKTKKKKKKEEENVDGLDGEEEEEEKEEEETSVRGEGRDFVEGVFQLERSGGVRVDDEDDWWRGRGEGDREDVVHEAGVREDVCGNAGDVCGENERVLRGVISRGLTRGKGGHHLRGNSHIANIATTTTTATTTTAITTRVRALT